MSNCPHTPEHRDNWRPPEDYASTRTMRRMGGRRAALTLLAPPAGETTPAGEDALSPGTPRLQCCRCGHNGSPRLSWQGHSNGMHLRADCLACGGYLRWVPQVPMWMDAAAPRPEVP